jgi:hypothetical protein
VNNRMGILQPLTNNISQKHSMWWMLVAISALSTLAWFVNTYAPETPGALTIFFVLFITFILSAGRIFIRQARHAWLLAFGAAIFLFLRLIGLHDALYTGLLITSLLSIELYLKKR